MLYWLDILSMCSKDGCTSWTIKVKNSLHCITMICTVYLFQCSHQIVPESTINDNSHQIYGFVYTTDGIQADSVLIECIPINHIATPDFQSPIDTFYTNSKGFYSIDSLSNGIYNIIGSKNGQSFFRSNIAVHTEYMTTNNLLDILKPSGFLHGIIKHQYETIKHDIIGIIPGTNRYVTIDQKSGIFNLRDMPDGIYHLQFLSSHEDFLPIDTTIVIQMGVSDTLSDTLYLSYTGVPQVGGFHGEFSQKSKLYTMGWTLIDPNVINGYYLYRSENNQQPILLTQSLIKDTSYCDSTIVPNKIYSYHVVGVRNGKQSIPSKSLRIPVIKKLKGWYKGQLHCHTTISDGTLSVKEVLALYRLAGYDFVAISDHNWVTPTELFSNSTFLTIPNDEFSFGEKHINAINATKHYTGSLCLPYKLQNILDAVISVGAIPQINHPGRAGYKASDIINATGVHLMEIINYRNDEPTHNIALWDSILSSGKQLYATAVDDAHTYKQTFNAGWIMVNTTALTKTAILQALETGSFYASTGPLIQTIDYDIDTMKLESIDGISIEFYGLNGTLLASYDSCSASYAITANDRYIRCEVTNKEGKKAYTQAYFPHIKKSTIKN